MVEKIRKKLKELSPSDKLDLNCVQRIANELNVDLKEVLLADAVFYDDEMRKLECPDWIVKLPQDVKDEIIGTADIIKAVFPKDESAVEEASPILALKEVKELLENVKADSSAFITASEEYQLSEAVVKKVAEITGKSILEIFLLSPQIYSSALMTLDDEEDFLRAAGGYANISWIRKLGLLEEEQDQIHKAAEAEQIIDGVISLYQASYDHSGNMAVLLSHFDYGLEEANEDIKSNPEAVLEFVKKFGTDQLSYASDKVKCDPSVLQAVAGMPDFDIEDLEPEEYEALPKIVAEKGRCHTGDSIGSGVNPRDGLVENFIRETVKENSPERNAGDHNPERVEE